MFYLGLSAFFMAILNIQTPGFKIARCKKNKLNFNTQLSRLWNLDFCALNFFAVEIRRLFEKIEKKAAPHPTFPHPIQKASLDGWLWEPGLSEKDRESQERAVLVLPQIPW